MVEKSKYNEIKVYIYISIVYSETTPVATNLKNQRVGSIIQELPILEPVSSSNEDLHIPPCLVYDNDYIIGNNSDVTSPTTTGHEDYSPSYRTYSNSRTVPHMSSFSNLSTKSPMRMSRFGSYTKLTSSPSS